MTDIDHRLSDSLKDAANAYSPRSVSEARNRFVARRRRRDILQVVASVAVVAALVAGGVVVATSLDRTSSRSLDPVGPAPKALPGEMMITARIDVGRAPTDVDGDGDRLYVSFEESRSLDVIDPSINDVEQALDGFEVTTFGGSITEGPAGIDVVSVDEGRVTAAGDGWLSTSTISPRDGSPDTEDTTSSHWNGEISDLLVTPGHQWVAGPPPSPSGGNKLAITRLDDPYGSLGGSLEVSGLAQLDFGYGYLWASQQTGDEGGLLRIDPESLESVPVEPSSNAPPDGSRITAASDVSAGAGGVWAIGSPGASVGHMLIRVDPRTNRDVERIVLPGADSSHFGWVKATEELGVFALARIGETETKLFRVDPASGEVMGDPLEFGAGPFALEYAFSSLWIADRGENTVYRIEVGTAVEPSPVVSEPNQKTGSTEIPAPTAGSIPDEVVLVCAEGGNRVTTDVVRPQPDGVHVVVNNRLNFDPGFAYRAPAGGGGGDNAPPGKSRFVLDVPPGPLQVTCYPKDLNEEPRYISVVVEDPEGLYADAELDWCSIVSSSAQNRETPEGDPDPAAVAREQLEFGMQDGDELRRAGYPDSRVPVFVVIRDGAVVAKTEVQRGPFEWGSGDSSFYTDGYEACAHFDD